MLSHIFLERVVVVAMGHNFMMKISQTKKSVYHAFGLNIDSEIPFLDMPLMEGIPDVVVNCGKVPGEIPNAKIKGVRYQAGPGAFLLRVDGIAGYYLVPIHGNNYL